MFGLHEFTLYIRKYNYNCILNWIKLDIFSSHQIAMNNYLSGLPKKISLYYKVVHLETCIRVYAVYCSNTMYMYRKTRKLCGSFIVRFNGWHTHYWCYVEFFLRFSIYVYFCVQKCRCVRFLLCNKPLPAQIAWIKSTHNFLLLWYIKPVCDMSLRL